MPLYVNSTPIRKLVKDNTVLHSLKVNSTEVFNDFISYYIDFSEKVTYLWTEHEDPTGRHFYEYDFSSDEIQVTVVHERTDGLPVTTNVTAELWVKHWVSIGPGSWAKVDEWNFSQQREKHNFSWTPYSSRVAGNGEGKIVIKGFGSEQFEIASIATESLGNQSWSPTPPWENPVISNVHYTYDLSDYEN